MVLFHANKHVFENDFSSVSSVIFNRYPNPYATHVLSIDTLSRKIDERGNLLTTRLIKKRGKLPGWMEFVVGTSISESWMIEYSIVDPKEKILRTFKKNIDHVRLLQVEEYTTYAYNKENKNTEVNSKVKFVSGFQTGFKNKIENLSRNKFEASVEKSRLGMALVLRTIEENTKKQSIRET